MRARQSQQIAQIMDEQQARLDLRLMIDAINVNADSLFHKLPLLI
jgi:hypothetical protein